MQFDTTYLTEAGRSLATGTLGGLDKIQFTRAVASSHDYSATPVNDLKKLTSIEDVQQTVDYSRIIKKDDTTLTMRVDFPSKDVTTAYSLYTVGFYARPENGDEILYGVLPSSLPDYIAAYDGKSNLNDSFQTDTTVSDADNVLITVSQAGSLNEADLDAIFASKHIATIDDIKANIPDTVIDGSKPADFKEAVTLEKGAVDGAGNAIATTKNVADGDATTLKSAKEYADTKTSGKADDSTVVHTADMRKPANQVASIDEVNAKQDKLDYTPANAANVVDRNPNTGTVSKPTDFTNLTVNGGKTVATSDDLKSLEANAWRVLTGSSEFLKPFTFLYRLHDDQKYMEAVIGGTVIDSNSSGRITVVDLAQIIDKITSLSGEIVNDVPSNGNSKLAFSGAKIITPNSNTFTEGAICSTLGKEPDTFFKISYSKLI